MTEKLETSLDRTAFATIDEALADFRDGRILLVVDDADRRAVAARRAPDPTDGQHERR